MRRILSFLFTIFISLPFAKAQGIQEHIAEVTDLIKKQSLFSEKVNWSSFSDSSKKYLNEKNDSLATVDFNRFVTRTLRALGDNHSFFINRKGVEELFSKNSGKENDKKEDQVESQMIGNVGYIKVPSFGSMNLEAGNQFSTDISNRLKKMDSVYRPVGWVVDLRGNGGGNMWPMLAGLNPLQKDEVPGYFGILDHPKRSIPWRPQKCKFKVTDLNARVAVLFDSATGSSGEMVAVAFIGSKNVRTFGTASAGYTTANQTFRLKDGSILQLATLAVKDRNGKFYTDRLVPDEFIIDNKLAVENNNVVRRAVEWVEGE